MNNAQDSSWRCCFTVWLYLAAKPSHMGVDVDRLACPLYYPTAYSRLTRGHGLLSGVVLSHRCIGRWRLSRDVKPRGLDIWWIFDRLGTYVIEFYMEYIIFTKICLPYVRAIMAFRRVSLV
jgi:hypothetical protein